MHAEERERLILGLVRTRGFTTFQQLDSQLDASPATIRRDLARLAKERLLVRVRGGVRLSATPSVQDGGVAELSGVPFHENIGLHPHEKSAIGRAAAAFCVPGEGVMIDGGSTTLQMCPHLAGLNLQVLTNSLHIVDALLSQPGTRILVPAGSVFREQNIILSASGHENMTRFHAPKLFMGAAAVGPHGIMQADVILVVSERRLIERAEEIILLVDSSKFQGPSGHIVCGLDEIDVVITDAGVTKSQQEMVRAAGVRLIIAD
ncbi:MAG TPA: DeoR/GlpR family DNA-binding transcription regulator [Caulobacteraceae bacterium]|nr:DeoR/GlpR family DNA-binding transcription regulator [Caulobacteraceae bacterium]